MKYRVQKDIDWKDFAARKGDEIDAAALVAGGKPIPPDVLAIWTKAVIPGATVALVPVEQPADPAAPEAAVKEFTK